MSRRNIFQILISIRKGHIKDEEMLCDLLQSFFVFIQLLTWIFLMIFDKNTIITLPLFGSSSSLSLTSSNNRK